MCIATGQRNYVSLIYWRRGRSGFIEPKPFSTIKAQSFSLSRRLPKVSPPPQPRPPQMAAKTWWSPPVSCDFNSSNSECGTSQTYKYRDGAFIFFIKRLDLFCKNSSSFVKCSPSARVVDDGVVRLEQLDCGEAAHLLTQHQHVVSLLTHDVHRKKYLHYFTETVASSLAVISILAMTTVSSSLKCSPNSSQMGASFLQWPHLAREYLKDGGGSH